MAWPAHKMHSLPEPRLRAPDDRLHLALVFAAPNV